VPEKIEPSGGNEKPPEKPKKKRLTTAAAASRKAKRVLPDVDRRGQQMLDSLPELRKPRPGKIFDQGEAQAYSCYAGICNPEQHESSDGDYSLRVIPNDKLWPESTDVPIPPLGEVAHDVLRAFILSEYFPCIGARAAFKRGSYRFGFYKQIGHLASAAAMGRDLRRFVQEYQRLGDFTSFIAAFQYPQSTNENEFESLLWRHLQVLHDNDIDAWDPHYSPDPEAKDFAFSFYGCAFFIVGMHSGSSRHSRRIGFPFLVFNPESQIRRLKEEGILQRFADEVRERDVFLQGEVNPSLPKDTDTSGGEARVYSGKKHVEGDGWKCPFKPRREVLLARGRKSCEDHA
jgi:uncharacterized protein